MTDINLSTLESHLWEAANILRGSVDAADSKVRSGVYKASTGCFKSQNGVKIAVSMSKMTILFIESTLFFTNCTTIAPGV